jgi:hypothetical protein
MPMRSIVAAAVLLALPVTAQAQFRSQPMPAADARLPGIVDRTPPGSHRAPGFMEVRIVPGDRTVQHDLREARETIDRRYENGELTRREARRLRREVRLVDRLQYRYGHDGLRSDERAELALRAQELRSRAAAPRH